MKIDQYSIIMVVITLVLLATYLITGNVLLVDLIKVAFGATLGTLAKKAETTIIVADAKMAQAITDKYI